MKRLFFLIYLGFTFKDARKNTYVFFLTRLLAGYRKQPKKIIKKNSSFSLMIFFAVLIMLSAPINAAERINYDSIYNNLPALDIYYDHNEDPDENADYEKYTQSPYPLIRISLKLDSRGIKLAPGYYLMSLRNRSNYDFVMFKQNGKIVALIPVYEKQVINPETIYPKPPESKSIMGKTGKVIKKIFTSPFKPHMKPPSSPRTYITSSLVDGGKYFEIWFYQEQYLNKMLFKVVR